MSLVTPVAGVTYWWDGKQLVAPGRPPLVPPSTGGGGGGTGMPAYPAMPSGWTMSGQAQLSTLDATNWTADTGQSNTSFARYYGFDTVTFSTGPLNDAVRLRVTYDGTTYKSAQLKSTGVQIPSSHVIECYMKCAPLGSGSFPAFWMRPYPGSGAQGELDHMEHRGRFTGTTSKDLVSTTMIVTPYTSPVIQSEHGFADKMRTNNFDETQWNHWRWIKTDTSFATYVNGVQMVNILRNDASTTKNITNAQWDSNFTGHSWYLILSHQFGNGSGTQAAGPPDPTLCPTDFYIRNIQIWK